MPLLSNHNRLTNMSSCSLDHKKCSQENNGPGGMFAWHAPGKHRPTMGSPRLDKAVLAQGAVSS